MPKVRPACRKGRRVWYKGKPVQGCVLYAGPSALDGKTPIVVIGVQSGGRKANRKTGKGIQVYILLQKVSPITAVQDGTDTAVCGDCPHRGTSREGIHGKARTCYVTVIQGPGSVYRAWQTQNYPRLTPKLIHEFFRGAYVRFGAYGDPAAVPLKVWLPLLSAAKSWTGYTHQWRTADQAYACFLMASVETLADRDRARAMGYRTFRVRTPEQAVLEQEVICPASKEGGEKVQCNTCRLCSGQYVAAKDVVIVVHGSEIANNYVGRTYARIMDRLSLTVVN